LYQQIGSCTVIKQTLKGNSFSSAGPSPLDAGALTLNGPGVSSKALTDTNGDYYAGLNTAGSPTGVLQAGGTYTLTGAGGTGVGAFTGSITLTSLITWNQNITQIVRTQPLQLQWTGGGSGDTVNILGMSGTVTGTAPNQTTNATIFICLAKASDGQFTVPTTVLSQLDAVAALSTTSIGLLSVNSITTAPFTAPLTAGGNVDYAVMTASSGNSKAVPFHERGDRKDPPSTKSQRSICCRVAQIAVCPKSNCWSPGEPPAGTTTQMR
jgi:hypothetical protein